MEWILLGSSDSQWWPLNFRIMAAWLSCTVLEGHCSSEVLLLEENSTHKNATGAFCLVTYFLLDIIVI